VLTTFADNPFFLTGSSDDDDDDDCSAHSSDEEGDNGSSSNSSSNSDDHSAVPEQVLENEALLEEVTRNWERGARADSTLGEWTRVHGVLQKWYHEQEVGFRVFLGPLTRPYSR
jgi:hypothetical protein